MGPEGVRKFRTREMGTGAMSREGANSSRLGGTKKGAGFSGTGAELSSA